MFTTHILNGIDDIAQAEWEELTREADLDFSAGFLRFREYLEPGDSVLVTVRHGEHLRGALHGALSVAGSGMSSDPWKFVTADSVLRPAEDGRDDGVSQLRSARSGIVRRLAGAGASDGRTPLWRLLTDALGSCLVIREFDASRLVHRADLASAEVEQVTWQLVRSAQDLVVRRGAGALCFPYVETGNEVLRTVLGNAGFHCGVMTAASRIPTAGYRDYEEYLAAMPSRRRRRYKLEEEALSRAAGLEIRDVELADNLSRVAALEAQTLVKHGGAAVAESLRQARAEMVERLPHATFVPAVEHDGTIVACAVHLIGKKAIYFMAYGCDYTVEDRSSSYPWAAFYSPVRRAIREGLDAVLLGLEGLEAKSRRGAVVEPRETWMWLPDPAHLRAARELLDLVSTRNLEYLERFAR